LTQNEAECSVRES